MWDSGFGAFRFSCQIRSHNCRRNSKKIDNKTNTSSNRALEIKVITEIRTAIIMTVSRITIITVPLLPDVLGFAAQ